MKCCHKDKIKLSAYRQKAIAAAKAVAAAVYLHSDIRSDGSIKKIIKNFIEAENGQKNGK